MLTSLELRHWRNRQPSSAELVAALEQYAKAGQTVDLFELSVSLRFAPYRIGRALRSPRLPHVLAKASEGARRLAEELIAQWQRHRRGMTDDRVYHCVDRALQVRERGRARDRVPAACRKARRKGKAGVGSQQSEHSAAGTSRIPRMPSNWELIRAALAAGRQPMEDYNGEALPPTEVAGPEAPPGSEARMALYARRYRRREQLHSAKDWLPDRGDDKLTALLGSRSAAE